jgi:hypothetical protein
VRVAHHAEHVSEEPATAALANPSPRGVIGWYSRTPIGSSLSNAAVTSSTCQSRTARVRVGRRAGGHPPAADEPQRVLVVADAELGVGGPCAGSWPLEVRLDAERLSVPSASPRRGHRASR